MPRRLHQTLIDYVVIAISPALIMALVGSLVFFLLQVFYQGDYQGRLHWVMGCFVFAAVLIGRISIEEGFERAAMFGAVLAVAMAMASQQFMEFHGAWIENISWLINWSLIALAWWCAHRLVWDCTLIDDDQDSSGEGLLQTAGLERSMASDAATDAEAKKLEGTTSRAVPASYWQRYVEHQRRPHAPGVWVVYFSLAALPLFGIGQWFIPESNATGRVSAFWLLSVYVASALGLLLTTSFLGLRRYLRQRRIEMPTLMANLWLTTGAVLIVALVAVAAMLPRPSAEYAIARLPFTLGSPNQQSSQYAPADSEGTEDQEPGKAPERTPEDEDQKTEQSESEPSDTEPQANESGGEGKKDAASGEGDQPMGEPSSQRKDSSQQGQGQQAEGKQGSQPSKSGGEANDARESKSQPPAAGEKKAKADSKSRLAQMKQQLKKVQEDSRQQAEKAEREAQKTLRKVQQQPEGQEQEKPQESSDPSGDPSQALQAPTQAIRAAGGALAEIFRWVILALVALAVVYACWRYRHEIAAAFREFLAALADFWNHLWGNKRARGVAGDDEIEFRVPPAPFSSFADPFATGVATRYSLTELVRYSFEAFEAWAREHGCPRLAEQTPHEFARDVGRINAVIITESKSLAELYARAAYARGELPATAADQLRQLWQKMRANAAPPAPLGVQPGAGD